MTPSSSAAKYRKDDNCCSKNLLRNYLYVFNFFFLCGGLIVLGVGVWSIWSESNFITLLSTVSYPLTSYLLVAAGLLALVASFIGCCGIKKSDRCFLLVYIVMLLLIFLLEVKAGILAYIYREQAYNQLEVNLNQTFVESYGYDEVKTNAIDDMQRKFDCCGAISYSDWQNSKWYINKLEEGNLVPDSCCKSESPKCGVRDHPNNIFYTGCIHQMANNVKDHLGFLTIAALGLCILQVIGIIFSTCLYIRLKDPEITDL